MHPYFEDNASKYSLLRAAAGGEIPEVERLVSEGARVRQRGVNGETALHWIAARGELETAKLLIAAGAYAAATDFLGQRPECIAKRFNHPEVADYLESESLKELGRGAGFKEKLEREEARRRNPLPPGPYG